MRIPKKFKNYDLFVEELHQGIDLRIEHNNGFQERKESKFYSMIGDNLFEVAHISSFLGQDNMLDELVKNQIHYYNQYYYENLIKDSFVKDRYPHFLGIPSIKNGMSYSLLGEKEKAKECFKKADMYLSGKIDEESEGINIEEVFENDDYAEFTLYRAYALIRLGTLDDFYGYVIADDLAITKRKALNPKWKKTNIHELLHTAEVVITISRREGFIFNKSDIVFLKMLQSLSDFLINKDDEDLKVEAFKQLESYYNCIEPKRQIGKVLPYVCDLVNTFPEVYGDFFSDNKKVKKTSKTKISNNNLPKVSEEISTEKLDLSKSDLFANKPAKFHGEDEFKLQFLKEKKELENDIEEFSSKSKEAYSEYYTMLSKINQVIYLYKLLGQEDKIRELVDKRCKYTEEYISYANGKGKLLDECFIIGDMLLENGLNIALLGEEEKAQRYFNRASIYYNGYSGVDTGEDPGNEDENYTTYLFKAYSMIRQRKLTNFHGNTIYMCLEDYDDDMIEDMEIQTIFLDNLDVALLLKGVEEAMTVEKLAYNVVDKNNKAFLGVLKSLNLSLLNIEDKKLKADAKRKMTSYYNSITTLKDYLNKYPYIKDLIGAFPEVYGDKFIFSKGVR